MRGGQKKCVKNEVRTTWDQKGVPPLPLPPGEDSGIGKIWWVEVCNGMKVCVTVVVSSKETCIKNREKIAAMGQ